jgi:hypothetical protein
MERRSRLESIVPKAGLICATVQTEMFEVAEEWLVRSRELHLEGVVAKRADESYRNGKCCRVKVKHLDTVDLVVGGYAGTPSPSAFFSGRTTGTLSAMSGKPWPFLLRRVQSLRGLSRRSPVRRASVTELHPDTAGGTATASRSGFPSGRCLSVESPSPAWTGTFSATRRALCGGEQTRAQQNALWSS